MMKAPVPGVYISWPFCAQKCTYCNFASAVLPRELEVRYLAALLSEISSHNFSWQPDTVYLGGGTPSAMDTDHGIRLLSAMRGPWREATIEAAPGTVTAERIDAWLRGGINRVSLGVQSFVRQELALLRARGIPNINIDLIAGLPGQSESSWNESLASAIALDPPHVSVYMLEVDDDSRLGAEIRLGGKRYGATDVPSDDRIADFYETAVDQLRSHGIHRYEISNFAHPGAESIHNLKYWKREPYVGFGADAHSFDGMSRSQNVESARDYVARSERGESLRCEQSTPDPGEEKFFVGLRLSEGVRANDEDWARFGPAFDYFLSNGVLERADGNLSLTPRGVMVSNEVFREFLTT